MAGGASATSDCSVVLPGVAKWGVDDFVKRVDGMFAMAVCAWGSAGDDEHVDVWLCRDRFGVKPLLWGTCAAGCCFGFASEARGLPDDWPAVHDVTPGCVLHVALAGAGVSVKETRFALPWPLRTQPVLQSDIRAALMAAVRKQVTQGDRTVAVLLSGGVDSALIAAIAARELARTGQQLRTFTICHDAVGRSADAEHARATAQWIGSAHEEIAFSSQQGISALSHVIRHVETHDVITVRAAVPLYLLAQHVRAAGCDVVLVGEGADELFGGYSLFRHCADAAAMRAETERTLALISDAELLRVDRCTMACGVEARVPYLDAEFAALVMHDSCQSDKLWHAGTGRVEKLLLRACFEGWLPDTVLYRQKEQMADGVGRQWLVDLRQHALAVVGNNISEDDAEAVLYKRLFQAGGGRAQLVSARSLRRKQARVSQQLSLSGSLYIRQQVSVASDPQLSGLISAADATAFCTATLCVPAAALLSRSVATLNALVQASLQTVAYHNLTVLVRPRRPPTMQEIRDDFLCGLGGPCAVVNAGFAALLHALGFAVYLTPATIHRPDCHVALLVRVRGRVHYVDVANGKPYAEAVPLGDERPRGTARFQWKLVWDGAARVFHVLHGSAASGGWRTQPAVSFDPQRVVHYASFHAMLCESRTSRAYGPFLRGLRIALFATPYQVASVRDTELTAHALTTAARDEKQLVEFAARHFARPVVEMLPAALRVLREQGDHLWASPKL